MCKGQELVKKSITLMLACRKTADLKRSGFAMQALIVGMSCQQ
jgi:hypothetical protein